MKRIISVLIIFSLLLIISNHIVINRFGYNSKSIILTSVVFLSVGLFFAFVNSFLKEKKNKIVSLLTVFVLSISIFIGINNSVSISKYKKYENLFYEYNSIETCEEMETRFNDDLKNNELKYFSYGIGADKKLIKYLKRKYKIETFIEGCTIFGPKPCYNRLLNEYLKEKHNDSIIDY